MKRQPMTWGRWLELIFGAILPAILAGFVSVFEFKLFLEGISIAGFSGAAVPSLLSSILPVGAVIVLWLLILWGPERINRRPILRWLTLGTDIAGLAFVFIFLIPTALNEWKAGAQEPAVSTLKVILWLGVIGPVFVGLRHLPRLLRGTQRAAQALEMHNNV